MAQPGMFKPPGDEGWVARRLQELEARVARNEAANIFGLTGIMPKNGGTEFEGYVNVNGPMSITGTLNLPAGIIGNDALANPISATVVNAGITGFSMGTGLLQQKLSTTVAVPDGFSKAQVVAYADMTATNSTADQDYAFVLVKIDGAKPAYSSGTTTPPGRFAYSGSSFSRVLTGLGASFDITVDAGADMAPWAADPDYNVINLNAMVTFLR